MTHYLITKWFGTFLCDENGIQKEILFPKQEKEIIQRLQEIEKNCILNEEKTLAQNTTVVVNEKRLRSLGTYDDEDPFFQSISINPNNYGFTQELFHTISLHRTQQHADEQLQSEDLQLMQMVNALDDLIQTANLLSERLACWSLIPTPKKKVKPFEKTLAVVNEEIERLQDQIEVDMKSIAPNTSSIIGPLIGARLIALAGGMQRMAMLPASTVQILGAEKALFRFKKEGGKPPKHGVIFQHPLINRAPRAERGKIARLLAIKTSTAMKADVFTKRNIADELQKEIDCRLEEIRNKINKKKGVVG
jgi:nucleolar protein 56